MIKKSLQDNNGSDSKFKYFQRLVLEHLNALEDKENKDRKELKKSLISAERMQKSGYPVGTVRVWKGKKFIKIAPGKWKPKYDSQTRGAKMAITALKRKAESCKDSKELMQLILENRDRFSDKNGSPLPFVKELSDYISGLNDHLEYGNQRQIKEFSEQIKKMSPKEIEKEIKDKKEVLEVLKENGKAKNVTDVYQKMIDDAEEQLKQAQSNKGDPKEEPKTLKMKSIETIRDNYKKSNSIDGDEDSITMPDGTELEGKWKLVEANSPTASHDESTFHKTEGFPTNEDGTTINDRDYEHDNAAQEAVLDIASDFDSRALGIDNPVVVSEDGVVISGNNRTMSSKIAAKNGTDKKYIDALNKKCKKFGFTQDDVSKFKNPRVVFETKVNGKYSTKQCAKFNQSGKKAQSPVEQAVKVAKTVTADTVESIAQKINEYDTLGELYADNKAMQGVFDTLITNEVIQKTDLPAYYTQEGGVSNNGKEFLETVLIGSVINENNIRSLSSAGGKALRQKLVRAIVPLVENKGLKGYSIIKELNEAVRIAVEVAKNHDKFPSVEEFSKQNDMFRELDPVSVKFAKKLEGTQKEFAEFMREINSGLKPAANGEADIFLGGVESKDEILNRYLSIKKAVAEVLRSLIA